MFHHSHTIFLSEPQREIWVLLYWSEAMPRQPQRPIWPFCCGKDDCRGCLRLFHIVVLWVYKWLWFWVYNIKKINRHGMIHILSKNTIPMLVFCSKWAWTFEHHIQIWHAYHIFISEFHDVKIRISLNCSKVSLSIAALNQAMYKNRVENGNFVEIHFISSCEFSRKWSTVSPRLSGPRLT